MTGTELAIALLQLKLTQRAFAAEIGVNRSTIWRWEQDLSPVPPYVDAVLRLKTELASTQSN